LKMNLNPGHPKVELERPAPCGESLPVLFLVTASPLALAAVSDSCGSGFSLSSTFGLLGHDPQARLPTGQRHTNLLRLG
jgi:hypothetical protein